MPSDNRGLALADEEKERESRKSWRKGKSAGQRGAARSRALGLTDSFSKQRDHVGDWQERWTKVKSGIGQLKQVSESHYAYYVFFFFISRQRARIASVQKAEIRRIISLLHEENR